MRKMTRWLVMMLTLLSIIPYALGSNITFNSSFQPNTTIYLRFPDCAFDNQTNTTFCANQTKVNIVKALQYSEILQNNDINLTISAPPFAVLTLSSNATCSVNKTLSGNETFTNNTAPCNVTVSSFQTDVLINVTAPEPKFGNSTDYNTTVGSCSLKLKIPACPSIGLITPPNFTLIEIERKEQLVKYEKTFPDLNLTNIELKSRLSDFQLHSCAVDDKMFLENYNKLADFQKTYLAEFSKLRYPVSSFQFTNLLVSGNATNQTSNDFNTVWFYSDNALKRYVEIGFAKQDYRSTYRPTTDQFYNETTYEPNVTTSCLYKITGLSSIYADGQWNGVKLTVGISAIIFVFIMGWMYISNRAISVPVR